MVLLKYCLSTLQVLFKYSPGTVLFLGRAAHALVFLVLPINANAAFSSYHSVSHMSKISLDRNLYSENTIRVALKLM